MPLAAREAGLGHALIRPQSCHMIHTCRGGKVKSCFVGAGIARPPAFLKPHFFPRGKKRGFQSPKKAVRGRLP